jgi:hypothetical protein
LLTVGYFVFDRYSKNTQQIVPYPYSFKQQAPAIAISEPILFIGDRMGAYLSKFKEQLAVNISVNLDNAIQISSIAKEGKALHRTIHELKSLTKWPQILIYHGGSEEFREDKFKLEEVKKIKKNFDLFKDDRIETLLILFPQLSRLIYTPINKMVLDEEIPPTQDLNEEAYLKRFELELILFEQHLNDLITLSRDRNALIILTTTPINLDIKPKASCSFTSNMDLEKAILETREELRNKNPKLAYNRSTLLIQKFPANASLHFLHGQISKRLGKIDEAVEHLLKASFYDCSSWRTSDVHNSIIRKVAEKQKVLLFDFAALTDREYSENVTFFDEIYPQNLYYEKAIEQLGLAIKSILKL